MFINPLYRMIQKKIEKISNSPKAALAKMGVCGEMVRRPLIPTTDANKKLLFDAMEKFEKKGY